MGAGLCGPGSNQPLSPLGVGRGDFLWAALRLSQSLGCEEGFFFPLGDPGELAGVIIPPGEFMKSFLPVCGGS